MSVLIIKRVFLIQKMLDKNTIDLPESFNTNISHQLFDYTIIFLNSQNKNTNSKGDFVHKTGFKLSF